jgi:hypothetical protein
MAADVLLYNALNESNRTLVGQDATLTANIAAQNALCTTAQNTINTNQPLIVGNAGPHQANLWCLIPTLPATGCAWSAGLKVCDTSGYFRAGACCQWTVPVGVTCARFQIWGAGAGTGYGCCCAFTTFGGTGAYASVIMPVTAGNTYTLCSGCALCCCATAGGTNDTDGCPSFVVGVGLTNFCAEGGEGSLYCQLTTRGVLGGNCMFLGGCICTNNSVCWGGTSSGVGAPLCCFDNMFPMISSCKTYYGSATSGTVYGIRGSFGSIAVSCNGTVRVQDAPVYGFSTLSCCCCIYACNSVSGWCLSACAGYRQYPGGGGSALFQCGGSNGEAGDSGRMGMVCVSYL